MLLLITEFLHVGLLYFIFMIVHCMFVTFTNLYIVKYYGSVTLNMLHMFY
jgi:hypothetical protein